MTFDDTARSAPDTARDVPAPFGTDDRVRQRIRALGSALLPTTFADTAEIMASVARRPGAAQVQRDIVYGSHPRHRLDLFRTADTAPAKPVILYVHGGGFIAGDKGNGETPFYDNIGRWAAQAGAIGVTMNYLPDQNHLSPALGIGRPDDLLSREIQAFVARHAPR